MFKFKVTHEKPIRKIEEEKFTEHFQTTASILKTVWSKRQSPGVFCKKEQKRGVFGSFRRFAGKCLGFFLMKLLVLEPESLLKRNSGAADFLQDLRDSCWK